MDFYENPAPETGGDVLPQYFNYSDGGCVLEPSCLKCGLLTCAVEMPGGINGEVKRRRDEKVCRKANEGLKTGEIASKLDISTRTVQRVLRSGRKNGQLRDRL